MAKKAKGNRPRLVVYITKTVVDGEDRTYAVRGVPRKMLKKIADKLDVIDELLEVRIEEDEIIVGVGEDESEEVYDCSYDEDDGITSYSSGQLTEEVRRVVESVVGSRVTIYFHEETRSLGELVFGENWETDIGLTEDEREVLSH